MNTYILVFICQILFIVVKFMGTRHTINGTIYSRLIVSNFGSLIWLVTTYLGVSSLLSNDWYVLIPYLLGTSIGILLEDKIRRYF